MKLVKIQCSECKNSFNAKELKPYRYDPSQLLCIDCEVAKSEEDEQGEE